MDFALDLRGFGGYIRDSKICVYRGLGKKLRCVDLIKNATDARLKESLVSSGIFKK